MGYNEAALKDLFNNCLDNPLPRCEMMGLETLDFWGFTNYLQRRITSDRFVVSDRMTESTTTLTLVDETYTVTGQAGACLHSTAIFQGYQADL